jgi:hypothetical protein
MDARRDPDQPAGLRVVESGERVDLMAEAGEVHLLLTDRRVVVAAGERVSLDVPFAGLRRVQFDIERKRPATLVIVPEDPRREPQVLAVPPSSYGDVTAALATIGQRLAESEEAS